MDISMIVNTRIEAAWPLIGLCSWVVRFTETVMKATVLCHGSGTAQDGKLKIVDGGAKVSFLTRNLSSSSPSSSLPCTPIYLAIPDRCLEARHRYASVYWLLASRRRKSSNGSTDSYRSGRWLWNRF